MTKKVFFLLGLSVFLGIQCPLGHANEQVASALFSNSVKALMPEVNPASQSSPQDSEQNTSNESLGFLAEGALKPADTPPRPLAKTSIHFLTGIDVDQIASPVSLEKQLQGVEIPVSVLVFEKCTDSGDKSSGSSLCEWRYSSGFKSTLSSRHTDDGEKKISYFTLTENDSEGSWQGKREVVHTTTLVDGKIATETYDILYDSGMSSPGKSIEREGAKTREVLRYDYDTTTTEKKIKDMSWTKYADTRDKKPREMEYHAVLTYDQNGHPERGRASKWVSGWKAHTLFDWQSKKDVPDATSRELWQMWEQWIKNGPSHVFIV